MSDDSGQTDGKRRVSATGSMTPSALPRHAELQDNLDLWAQCLTPELEAHFARMGVEIVTADVLRHAYEDPDKHFAAHAWLNE